jgi:anti-sigma factor RsiW
MGTGQLDHSDVIENLEGFLDGTLAEDFRRSVERHLAECEECWAKFVTAQRLEWQLRTVLKGESTPATLLPGIRRGIQRGVPQPAIDSRRRAIGGAMAAVAVFAATALGLWIAIPGKPVEARVMTVPVGEFRDWVGSKRPLDVVEQDPERLQRWFVPKVAFDPPKPLGYASGINLNGGRLCNFFNRWIASYMYTVDGHVASLYIMPADGLALPVMSQTALRAGGEAAGRASAVWSADGYSHVLWLRGGLIYSLVAELPASRLQELSGIIAGS